MTQQEFDDLLAAKKEKEAVLAASFSQVEDTQIDQILREFICCKYFLEPEEMATEDLVALGNYSTAKMAGLKDSGISFKEKSAGCTTAPSGVIKKVLLAMAIGRLIGVKLNPDHVADVTTISQMRDLIIETRKAK